MLLERERARHTELEQEVLRLRAGLDRQNARIIQLERQNAQLRRLVAEQEQMIAGLQEQDALLRQQVALLTAENARLMGTTRPPKAPPGEWPSQRTKQDREATGRKKRDGQHNHGRRRMEQVDERIDHAVKHCPDCGTQLRGGWVHRRVQVIELPPPAPVIVTEHVLWRRQCPRCHRRMLPAVPAEGTGRIGRGRFGPRLLAAIATMAITEHLPLGLIRRRLSSQHGLHLSQGGVVGLLRQIAQHCTPAYETFTAEVRAGPVTQSDETGWREDGIPGYVWTLSTPTTCVFHRDPHRSGAVIDRLLGEDFGGTLVTDFYSAYDHLPGLKQRCWAHLWRDIDALEQEYPEDADLAAWVAGVRAIYDLATGERPGQEVGPTPEADRARASRAGRYEQQLFALCPETIAADRPQATLAKRIRRYLSELFTFVADPAVPATNNAAERNLRPLVIGRKVSGGTRSAEGSTTHMVLASVVATARLRSIDPTSAFLQILTSPSHTF